VNSEGELKKSSLIENSNGLSVLSRSNCDGPLWKRCSKNSRYNIFNVYT
jgi:hypothetical protein